MSDPVEELHDNLNDPAGLHASLSDPISELNYNLYHPMGLQASFSTGLFASLRDPRVELHVASMSDPIGHSMVTSMILLGYLPV